MSGELKILTPIGMLGYGFSLDHFWDGIEAGADAIVIDSGSTDNGPQELALGKRTCSRSAYLRDLEPMLEAPPPVKSRCSSARPAGRGLMPKSIL